MGGALPWDLPWACQGAPVAPGWLGWAVTGALVVAQAPSLWQANQAGNYEPERLARRWAEMAEVDLGEDDEGNPSFEFDNCSVRVVPDDDGRGEGLGGIDVTTVDRDAVLAGAEARGCAVSDDEVRVAGLRVYLR